MSDEHSEIAEEGVHFFGQQEVTVDDFQATGFILDLGGGGEGVIGRLKGKQVVAIDRNERELQEAPGGPLKVIMDVTDLKFLDETFGVATAFYTLMYIQERDGHSQAFSEVRRVLTAGGRFLLWLAIFPPREDAAKDIAVFPITVKLPGEAIEAGYGAHWPEGGRALGYYVELAREAGFEVFSRSEQGLAAFLELRKP